MSEESEHGILREVKTDPTKCIRFSVDVANGTVTAVFTYHETHGWAMRHPDGREFVWPSEGTVNNAFEIYDTVQIINYDELND